MEGSLEERLRTVVHGAIGALPRKLRAQAAAQFQAGTLGQLTGAMAAWIYGRKMDAVSFAHHFFGFHADARVVGFLRAAVSETVAAETRPQLAAASEHLADAIKVVGVDGWPRFVADAQARAHDKATLAAIKKSQQPVIQVSATVGASGSGSVGSGTRLAGGAEEFPFQELMEAHPGILPQGGGAMPEAGAPAAEGAAVPGAMPETETPEATKPVAPPAEAAAAKPAAETTPYIKLPSQLEPGFDSSKPIGHFTVPPGLTPGTTLFGDYVHEEIVELIEDAATDVEFTDNTAPGMKGVDIEVPTVSIAEVGFRYAEIKPLTKYGIRSFAAQVARWKLPGPVQAISYDSKGNIYLGFPTVK